MKNINGFAAALRRLPSPASATRSAGSTLKRLVDQARQAVRKYLPTSHGAPGQNPNAVSRQNLFPKLQADHQRDVASHEALSDSINKDGAAPALDSIKAMRRDLGQKPSTTATAPAPENVAAAPEAEPLAVRISNGLVQRDAIVDDHPGVAGAAEKAMKVLRPNDSRAQKCNESLEKAKEALDSIQRLGAESQASDLKGLCHYIVQMDLLRKSAVVLRADAMLVNSKSQPSQALDGLVEQLEDHLKACMSFARPFEGEMAQCGFRLVGKSIEPVTIHGSA